MLKNTLRFLHRGIIGGTPLIRNGVIVCRDTLPCEHMTQLARHFCAKKGDEEEDTVRNHPDVKSVLKEMKQHFSEDDRQITTEKPSEMPNVSKYLQEKFVLYRDQEAEVILDVHEELERIGDYHEEAQSEQQTKHDERKYQDLNLERGISGVFDVDHLVEVLLAENAIDICVIQIAKELCYADYLVLASGRSPRHLMAIIQFVRKMYKRKKNKKDNHLKTQGGDSDWQALDMGNIVLHVMLPKVREKYDIETLWSVGEKYDRLSHQQEKPIFDAIQKHITFLQEMQPIPNQNQSSRPNN